MARVNVYASVQTDRRTVSIGGRSANDWATARLNTDNGAESNVCATLDAQVVGNLRAKDRTKANGGDNRRSRFTFTVPECESPAATTVSVVVPSLERAPETLTLQIGGTAVPIRELWELWRASKAK